MNTQIKVFLGIIALLILGTIVTVVIRGGENLPGVEKGKYDNFAMCLKERGAVFYGAFWCSHCQAQKDMFGSSAKYLPYVECSTLDGRGQTNECKTKNIEGYPAWEFANGERIFGEVELKILAEKTSCELPL